jgi:protein subunit release factor A
LEAPVFEQRIRSRRLMTGNFMLEKLAQIEKNYEELTAQISSPEIMSDMKVYAKTMKQHRSLEEIVERNIAKSKK